MATPFWVSARTHVHAEPRRQPRCGEAGLTLIEISIGIMVFTLGVISTVSVSLSSARLEGVNRSTALATAAARGVIEDLEATPFEEIFKRFNSDPQDDPEGPGTALGDRFVVKMVAGKSYDGSSRTTSYSGSTQAGAFQPEEVEVHRLVDYAIQVRFPTDAAGSLTETAIPVLPGLPTDLNSNGIDDAGSRADDYVVLPVAIDVTWTTAQGPRTISIPRIITE